MCYSIFGMTDCTRKIIQLILNNTAIKPVECLGIIIDSNLTWEEHINQSINQSINIRLIMA